MIELQNQPSHADQVIAQDVSGTLVLLSIPSGQYYSLNELGSRIWALSDGTRTVSDIIDIIRQEYDAPAERVRHDVMALLGELAAEHLVVASGQVAAGR